MVIRGEYWSVCFGFSLFLKIPNRTEIYAKPNRTSSKTELGLTKIFGRVRFIIRFGPKAHYCLFIVSFLLSGPKAHYLTRTEPLLSVLISRIVLPCFSALADIFSLSLSSVFSFGTWDLQYVDQITFLTKVKEILNVISKLMRVKFFGKK